MGKPRILITEDEIITAIDIREKLERFGYIVTDIASSGEEAMASIQKSCPDLILMDILIQGDINGIQTAEQIRRDHDIPIIFLTAHADRPTLKKAKAAVPHGYIVKPFKDEELFSVIEMALHKHSIEHKLKESEKRYRDLYEKMLNGYLILEPLYGKDGTPEDFRIIAANPAFERITGLTAAGVTGQTILQLEPDAGKQWITPFTGVFMTREPELLEGYLRKFDKWFTSYIFYTGDGQIGVMFEDITDRHNAENALIESEKKYRELVENANSIIIRIDTLGNITFFNEFAQKFFGYTSDEILGKHVINTIIPEIQSDGRDLNSLLMAILREPGNYGTNENENILKNGDRVWISWNNKAMYNSDGEFREILCVGLDITARKKLEQNLQASEEKFSKVFKSSPDSIVISTIIEGTIIDANDEFFRLSEMRRDDVIGRTAIELNLWKNPLDRKMIIHELTISGRVTNYEVDFHFGHRRLHTLYSAELIDINGEFCMLSMIRDVTDIKKAENERREAIRQLNDIIEFLPDATVVVNGEKNIIAWNKAMELLTGHNKEEMLGEPSEMIGLLLYNEKRPILLDSIFNSTGKEDILYENLSRENEILYAESFVPNLRAGEGAHIWIKVSPLFNTEREIVGAIESVRDVTSLKMIETALKESEEKFRLMFEYSEDPQFIIEDNVFIDCNESALRLLGLLEKDFIIGKHPADLSPENQPDSSLSAIQEKNYLAQALKRGSLSFEWIFNTFSGGTVPADVTLTTISLHGKKMFHAMCRDITTRKAAETALRESEERYRMLVETMNDGLLTLDTTGRITYTNQRICEMLGYTENELTGKHLSEFADSGFSGFMNVKDNQELISETGQHEIVFITKSGNRLYSIVSPRRIIDKEGTHTGNFGIFTDITERKKMEQELRTSEEKYRTIFETSGTAMIIFDRELKIQLLNKRLEHLLGYSREELEGTEKWVNFIAPDDLEMLLRYHALSFKDPKKVPGQYEFSLITKNGHTRECIGNFSIIPGTDLRVGSILDVTDQRKLMNQLLEISTEEQQRIGRDLHDGLGQHLTGIAFLSKVLEKKLNEKKMDEISDAAMITELINSAINTTRTLSKGLNPITIEKRGVIDTLEELAISTEDLFGITCSFTTSGPVLIQDNTIALHIYYIVREAVNNAVRHSGATNIEISFESKNDLITFSILDNGVGIDKKVSPGTGLGLNLMRYRAKMIRSSFEISIPESG
ncbi:MAG TPA: PAS domain S-box protein, partial [Spirochaetota bacterium]|nr:PAS domain S-box protein [Spirochaetota bacterium]